MLTFSQVRQSVISVAGLFYFTNKKREPVHMNRKERRAAEHAAHKAARKAGFPIVTTPNPATDSGIALEAEPVAAPPSSKPEISEAQRIANRANAQFSSGPKTEAGKIKCSHNAVKTALTGQTILLPTDDVAAYEKIGQIFIDRYKPASDEEERLVQSLIDARWRLMRIPVLEAGIYAIGREQLAGSVPAHLLEAHVYLKFERNFKNLHLQENRIRRNQEKDFKALKEIQAARIEEEAVQRKIQEMKEKQKQQQPPQPPPPEPQIGFVFSTPEIPAERPLENAA
jgi:hypothetical protein